MGAYELGDNLDQIIVAPGQSLALPAGGYSFTASLLSIGAGGTLDVADDTLGIEYSSGNSQAAQIAGWIASGSNGQTWTGVGIVSSATLGEPADLTGVGYFDDGTQIKIRRSWYGDTNLDGRIDADDMATMILGQKNSGTRWQDGNFNYDTKINADDWMQFALDAGYARGQMLPNPATPAMVSLNSNNDLLALLD